MGGTGKAEGRACPAPTGWWMVRSVMRARCAGGIYAAPTDNPLGEWLRWVRGRDESLAYIFKIKRM